MNIEHKTQDFMYILEYQSCLSATRMFPFSFAEYLRSQKVVFDIDTLPFSKKSVEIKTKFNEYANKGGFPEVIFYPSIDHKELLQSYFDDIIYRDIIARHRIRNTRIFNELALFCISNIAKPHTYNSLRKLFASYTSLSTDALSSYISYLEDAFLLFTVNHYDASLKKQINKPKKLYCIDPGLLNAVSFRFSDDLGRLYENIVFIQLLRSGEDIYYWQDKKGLEVDFVTKQGLHPTRLIQISVDISNQDTKQRQIQGLLSAMDHFGFQEGTIITDYLFDSEDVKGKKINYVPLWYWLLETDSANI